LGTVSVSRKEAHRRVDQVSDGPAGGDEYARSGTRTVVVVTVSPPFLLAGALSRDADRSTPTSMPTVADDAQLLFSTRCPPADQVGLRATVAGW
jgi:hypothetical protein